MNVIHYIIYLIFQTLCAPNISISSKYTNQKILIIIVKKNIVLIKFEIKTINILILNIF